MKNITLPTLIVDEDKCRRNIRIMATKAQNNNIIFRPHFKTHQSHAIGRWFREAGVTKITVSSLSMAQYFAQDQWEDILVAFPVNVREIHTINELASRIKLSILLADGDVMPALNKGLNQPVDFYIKIDIGTHRTGIDCADNDQITALLRETSKNRLLTFRGFVAHAGHTYQTQSLNDVNRIFVKGCELLAEVKTAFLSQYPDIIASWGDTPTCSLMEEFPLVDEIRPGNFVFYDLMQYHLGSCDWDQISVVVATPVVARHKSRNEIVLYGGAVHLSKDLLQIPNKGVVYGEVVLFTEKGWERFENPVFVERISQEHGIVHCPDEYWELFEPGRLVGVVPVHSCLSADLLRSFCDTEGMPLI
jgi:D-serine deaminase-like pyridoxal phosphate-dependent protein